MNRGDKVVYTWRHWTNSRSSFLRQKTGYFHRYVNHRLFHRGEKLAIVQFDGNKNRSRVPVSHLRLETEVKRIEALSGLDLSLDENHDELLSMARSHEKSITSYFAIDRDGRYLDEFNRQNGMGQYSDARFVDFLVKRHPSAVLYVLERI